MSQVSYITIAPNDEGQRLDNYLIRTLKGVPKSHFYRIIRQGEVRINKKRAKPSTKFTFVITNLLSQGHTSQMCANTNDY